jgi:hypothetical protein
MGVRRNYGLGKTEGKSGTKSIAGLVSLEVTGLEKEGLDERVGPAQLLISDVNVLLPNNLRPL